MGLRGLAALLDSPPRPSSTATITHFDVSRLGTDLSFAVNYVLGGSAGGGASLVGSGGGGGGPHIDYAAVADHVQQAVLAAATQAHVPAAAERSEQAAQGAEQPSSSGEVAAAQLEPASPSSASGASLSPAPPAGRLGPAEVTLVEAKGNADIQGLRATSCSNFTTVRSSACVFKGRWMYEAQLGSAGIMQVGGRALCGRCGVQCVCIPAPSLCTLELLLSMPAEHTLGCLDHVCSWGGPRCRPGSIRRRGWATTTTGKGQHCSRDRWLCCCPAGSAGARWRVCSCQCAAIHFTPDSRCPGACFCSYAYDGRRKQRWHVSNVAYGEQVGRCCLLVESGARLALLPRFHGLGFSSPNQGYGPSLLLRCRPCCAACLR